MADTSNLQPRWDLLANIGKNAVDAWDAGRKARLEDEQFSSIGNRAKAMLQMAGGDDTGTAPADATATGEVSAGPRAPSMTMGGGGGGRRMSMPVDPALVPAVVKYSKENGLDPAHVLTVMSYETGGTLDPWKAGPVTQWGQHRGLIQWGQPQAKQYGVGPDTAVDNQVKSAFDYLRDRGVQPGMGLLDIYSAVNAGGVGRYNASDARNGGAPGTVADKVATQMGGHAARARGLLAAYYDKNGGDLPSVSANGAGGVQVAGPNDFAPQALPGPASARVMTMPAGTNGDATTPEGRGQALGVPQAAAPAQPAAPVAASPTSSLPTRGGKLNATVRTLLASDNRYDQAFGLEFAQKLMFAEKYGFTNVGGRIYRTNPMTGEISDSGIQAPVSWHMQTLQNGDLVAINPQDPTQRKLIEKGTPYRPANEPELVGAGGRPGQGGQTGPNGKVELGPVPTLPQRYEHNGAVRTFNQETGADREILPAQPSTPFTPEQRKAYGLDDAQIGINQPNGQVSIQGSPIPDRFQKIDRGGAPYLQDMRDPSKPAAPVQFGGAPPEDPVQFAARQKAAEAEAHAAGEGRGKTLDTYLSAGPAARDKIGVLTQMRAALDAAGPNMTTGALGALVLQSKQAIEGALGVKIPGTTPTEVFNNLGPILAGAAARDITNRPALVEFQTLLRSKPGLANSVEGNYKLIDLMLQDAHHKASLSDLAAGSGTYGDFLKKRDAYEADPKNALINPFTGVPFGQKPPQAQALPEGYTRAKFIARAKATLAERPDQRSAVEQLLTQHGIDPAELR